MVRPGLLSACMLMLGLTLLQASVLLEQYVVFALGLALCVAGVLLGVQNLPRGARCGDRACPHC